MINNTILSTAKGTLFLVATPIGNRADITIRAINILFSADIILCEDTRKTYQLLQSYQNQKQILNQVQNDRKSNQLNRLGHPEFISGSAPSLESYFQGNEDRKMPVVLRWLQSGRTIALVSNSGTPLISDPGYKLVRECRRMQIPVVSVPGPCAAISALVSSGLPTDKFVFIGFLPHKPIKRKKIFESLKQIKKELNPTVIIYESPFRLTKTLEEIKSCFGDIEVVIANELTKKFEKLISITTLENIPNNMKGETIILF